MRPVTPSELTPTTPSLTPGISATTDDEETDFQSAYSASPRDSYGSFDGRDPVDAEEGEGRVSPVAVEKNDVGRRSAAHNLPKLRRQRVSSTATAIQGQPSPTFSQDTVISSGHALPKHTPVE